MRAVRLVIMYRHHLALVALATLLLMGCGQSKSNAPTADVQITSAAQQSEPAPKVQAMTPPSTRVLPAPQSPSSSRDPQVVIEAWADAVRSRNWTTAYKYWGDHGARSGKTLEQFSAQWSKMKMPLVVLGKGSQEGAAGSLYYTVPVTIGDGSRRISGELVLRRVNDVDGASAEQLRWHIDSATLQP